MATQMQQTVKGGQLSIRSIVMMVAGLTGVVGIGSMLLTQAPPSLGIKLPASATYGSLPTGLADYIRNGVLPT